MLPIKLKTVNIQKSLSESFHKLLELMRFFGDGVVAALGPRITSQDPPQSHKTALQGAEALDRFIGILGTGGIILTLG